MVCGANDAVSPETWFDTCFVMIFGLSLLMGRPSTQKGKFDVTGHAGPHFIIPGSIVACRTLRAKLG